MKKLLLILAILILAVPVFAADINIVKSAGQTTCLLPSTTMTYSIYLNVAAGVTLKAQVWDSVPACFTVTGTNCSNCDIWTLMSAHYLSGTANVVESANTTITVWGTFSGCAAGQCQDNVVSARQLNNSTIWTTDALICPCSPTFTPVYSPTFTPTFTITPDYSPTRTPVLYPSNTPRKTNTITPTFTITPTMTQTHTVSPTLTVTKTQVFYPTNTPKLTNTFSPTITPTFTITKTHTVSPTITLTRTQVVYPSQTSIFSATITPTISATMTKTITPTNTPYFSPTNTPTPQNTNTPAPWPNICDMPGNYLGAISVTGCASSLGMPGNPFSISITAGGIPNPLTVQDHYTYLTPTSAGTPGWVSVSANVAIVGLPQDVYYSITHSSDVIDSSNYVKGITEVHNKEHLGKLFRAGKYFDDTDYQIFNFVVPNGVTAHVRVLINTSLGSLTLNAYSGGNVAGGTTLTAVNFNMTSANITTCILYNGGALSGSLTSIQADTSLIGNNDAQGSAGMIGSIGTSEDFDSFILGSGSWKIIVNALSATVRSKILFEWYEAQ